jgi:sigma-E factor negative regulatory protein RseB
VSQGRVSGRIAQQVRIVSRDKTRYGISLWLDKHTGLPLKINTTDLDGQLVDQIQVTDLQILNQADSTFDNLQSDKLPSVVPYRQSDNMLTQVNFGFLPQGMNIVRQDRHFLPMLGQPVDYWLLSDGVVPISVFVHAGPKGSDILTRARAETILSQPVGRCYVTLIGKLPARTAKGIVDAMQIRNNQP